VLAFRDNSKYKATERKSLILRVPDIPPKNWRKKINHPTPAPQTKFLEASTQLKDATCPRQDFMVAKKIWRDIKKSADKLCAPGQKPFLILDKAPGHVGKKSQAELDEWWGKGNWMF
jgi:hypothetical protein